MTRDPAFFIPVFVLLCALALVQVFSVDVWLADFLYGLEGGHWALRGAWLTSEVLHKDAQKFSILIGVVTLGVIIASCFSSRLRPYRRGLIATLVAALTSLLLVSLSKHQLPLACPWDMQRYGGDLAGHAIFNFYWGQDVGGCFPAGHAAGGYCLLIWFFFARHYQLPHYRLALLPGVVIGLTYDITQELRGAHFLSHDLAAILLCWTVGYLVFRLIMGDLNFTHSATR
ncbi:phosphatase PAP2 family protein [Salinisphaera aquimarina]|uniref:Phosphatase PAP2 family protein n=1 Tax=Salinisphaera aquimarina TaxID=2094031 RepID=A0ABV7ERA0_9GAMM